MILSLCALAMVGTAAAQNPLFSFANKKMMENKVTLVPSGKLVTARSIGATVSASSVWSADSNA